MNSNLKKGNTSMDHTEISEIFKNNLKIENMVKSISTVFLNSRFSSKINYKPYFQRNYVWEIDKATYFIESIFLGTEIPPIVLFDNGETIEVIDGRQRFETLLKFINNDISLTSTGLRVLKSFSGKKYIDLPIEVRESFEDTKIRILQCSVVNEPFLDDYREDRIKKEIFKRYNSGIIPLKREEIQRAEYNNDIITANLTKTLKGDKIYASKLYMLFLSSRQQKMLERDKINTLISKIRQMITLPFVPIFNYANSSHKSDDINIYYNLKVLVEDHAEILKDIKEHTETLLFIQSLLIEYDCELKDNNLFFETCFWALSIIKQHYVEVVKNIDLVNFVKYMLASKKLDDIFTTTGSHYHKAIKDRHTFVLEYFTLTYNIDFEKHLRNTSDFSQVKSNKDSQQNEIKFYKLNKPEPTSMTIEDILKNIEKSRFMIRPSYQRSEVTNPVKSSYLLESIMINLKIPPIFVHKRSDRVFEVVDGQQRLLSIIGFMGKEYINEDGNKQISEKHKFKLKNLKILKELNGECIDTIDEKYINKLLDFQLEVIEIDQTLNPHFDSIDLFLRLNSKPYPIGENTFEMWNSYVDKSIIIRIKETAKKHSSGIFRQNDTRMAIEELITTLVYLEYKTSIKSLDLKSALNIYIKSNRINARIKSKSDITKILSEISPEKTMELHQCIDNIEIFISKLEALVNVKFGGIASIFDTVHHRKNSKTNQNYYLIWMILKEIEFEKLKTNSFQIIEEIEKLFLVVQNYPKERTVDDFLEELNQIHNMKLLS